MLWWSWCWFWCSVKWSQLNIANYRWDVLLHPAVEGVALSDQAADKCDRCLLADLESWTERLMNAWKAIDRHKEMELAGCRMLRGADCRKVLIVWKRGKGSDADNWNKDVHLVSSKHPSTFGVQGRGSVFQSRRSTQLLEPLMFHCRKDMDLRRENIEDGEEVITWSKHKTQSIADCYISDTSQALRIPHFQGGLPSCQEVAPIRG